MATVDDGPGPQIRPDAEDVPQLPARSPPTPLLRRVPKAAVAALAALHVIVGAGSVYGWTALEPVLLDDGYFTGHSDAYKTSRSMMVAILGISANALCKLPVSAVLDNCGPRFTSALGSLFLIAGALLLGFCDSDSALGAGYFLLGFSGPFIQLPCFQFSILFPQHQGAFITLLIACFELSTGVFFVFKQLYFLCSVPLATLFGAYAALGSFLFASAIVLWPGRIEMELMTGHPQARCDEEASCAPIKPDDTTAAGASRPECPEPAEGRLAEVCYRTPAQQLLSWEFLYASSFLAVHIFRQGFVLTTMNSQLEHFFRDDPDMARRLADAFSVFLPLGFLPMLALSVSGCNSCLMQRPRLALAVSTGLSMGLGLLFLWPCRAAYFALFAIFPMSRQLAFSAFFWWAAGVFGFESFGHISSVASTLAGLAQLLQCPLVDSITSPAERISWEQVDLLLALVPSALLLLPLLAALFQSFAQRSATEPCTSDGHVRWHSSLQPSSSFDADDEEEAEADHETPLLSAPIMSNDGWLLGHPTSSGMGSGRGVGIPGPFYRSGSVNSLGRSFYGSMQGSLLGGQHLAAPTPHFGSWASYTSSANNSLLGSSALLVEAAAAGLLQGQRHQQQQQAGSFTSTLYADHS